MKRLRYGLAFDQYVDKSEGPDGHWYWTGHINADGYGKYRSQGAHRVSYTLYVGPIPEGLTIDHVRERCTVRHCVQPKHLEAVTQSENSQRAWRGRANPSHCPRGHPYDEANTYRTKMGAPVCRACKRAKQAADYVPHPAPLREACEQGHPRDEANTRLNARGDRACRTCDAARARAYRARQRETT